MPNQHIISIEREARLSVDTGRLKIFFPPKEETHYIALLDIAVLVLAHQQISLSMSVLRELAQNGAVVLTTDEKFMPCALTLPLAANIDGARRPHLQSKYDAEQNGIWWAQLVQAKIAGQAATAQHFDTVLADKLRQISGHISPGDKECREALAAQHYWPAFFESLGLTIRIREKQGASDPVNISLNYAYAVLRAKVARALACAGLCLNLGLGHCRKDNPFNLADDFIESFRYIADEAVWNLFSQMRADSFTPEIKKQILHAVLQSSVGIAGRSYRLFHAVDYAVNSFCISLEDPRRKLQLPHMPALPGKKPNPSLFPPVQYEYETE